MYKRNGVTLPTSLNLLFTSSIYLHNVYNRRQTNPNWQSKNRIVELLYITKHTHTKEQDRAVQNGTHWGKLVFGVVLISEIGDKTGLVESPLNAGHIPPGCKHTQETAANTTNALNT